MARFTFWRVAALLLSFSLLIAYVILAGIREKPRIQASSKLRQIALGALLYADTTTTTTIPASPATSATPPAGALLPGSKYSPLGIAVQYTDEPVEWLSTDDLFKPSEPMTLLPSSKVTVDFSALLRAAGLAGPEAEADSPATRPATLPATDERSTPGADAVRRITAECN